MTSSSAAARNKSASVVRLQKTKIRTMILKRLRTQKEEKRQRKSFSVKEKLFSCKEFQRAKTVLFYASFGGEVETFPMIEEAQKQGKRIALPVIGSRKRSIVPSLVEKLKRSLEVNVYGIRQPKKEHIKPVAKKDIDLVIVPGVAFDKQGNRLGRGKGYYDTFLDELPRHTPTIGLAFGFQVIRNLPHERHDIPVDKVVFA